MLPFEKVCFGTAAISQYSNATPSGSFSASQAAAASRLVKTLRIGVADLFACVHVNKHAHFEPCPSFSSELNGSSESPNRSAHRSMRFSLAVLL